MKTSDQRLVRSLAAGSALFAGISLLSGCSLQAIGEDTVAEATDHASNAPATGQPRPGDQIQPPVTDSVEATVARVVDGDTLALVADPAAGLEETRPGSQEHTVRLLGIDAPEVAKTDGTPAQCGGDEAEAALAQLLPADTDVVLTYDTSADRTDRYGRSLGYVQVRDTDAAMELARDGLVAAWHPSSEPVPDRYPIYAQHAQQAESDGTGSWGACESLGR